MKIEADEKLDFDDVLIKPKRSEAASRASVYVGKNFKFKYGDWDLDNIVPIIAANMDTTGTFAMAYELSKFKAFTALHKFYDEEKLYNFFTKEDASAYTFYSMGISDADFDKFKRLAETKKLYFICIDVANGYTQNFVDYCRRVREVAPSAVIMAGNVATAEMTQELIINGKVDIVKIGIGPGSACTTRLKTGVGYPQLSAIAECADVAHGLNAHICADGGCKNPGDVAKAFGAGADFVMIGGMLAGTDECEGRWEYENNSGEKYWFNTEEVFSTQGPTFRASWPEGFRPASMEPSPYQIVVTFDKSKDGIVIKEPIKKALAFHGMSSKEAQDLYYGGMADYKCAEGCEITVPYKGKAEEIIKDVLGGLRSACAYVGASSLKDFPKCCTFVKVSKIKEYLYDINNK